MKKCKKRNKFSSKMSQNLFNHLETKLHNYFPKILFIS